MKEGTQREDLVRSTEGRERRGEIRSDKKWASEGHGSPQSVFFKRSGDYVLSGPLNVS